jgi:phage terminase large subunit-like protein
MDSSVLEFAAQRLRKLKLQEAFDAFNLDSRPTAQQEEIFQDAGQVLLRWVVAGNQSGKSSLAAREVAWVLQGTHPHWKRPAKWGNEPLLVIIAGQSRQMMEVELWEKKLRPLLDDKHWKPKKVGGQLVAVKNVVTNDQIVFLSHADGSEKNRKYLQGFVAHYVWMDEMPSDIKILEELVQRVASKQGLFLATFTPKVRNDRIRKFVDSAEFPVAKKYTLSKLDNPIYADRKAEEISKLKGLQPHEIQTILYGDWAQGDTFVYQFDYKEFVEKPQGYSPSWRHVEASDPAISSKFGFTLWAEDPSNGVWYCVKSIYIENIRTPERLVDEVIRLTKDVNIVRRVCDPHETWYLNTAVEKGLSYVTPANKNNRKDELIKGLQSALTMNEIKITPHCVDLIEEFQNCQYGEAGKIVNARSYHLLDTAQYFVDCMPKSLHKKDERSWARQQIDAHYKRKKMETILKVNRSGRSRWAVNSSGVWRLR